MYIPHETKCGKCGRTYVPPLGLIFMDNLGIAPLLAISGTHLASGEGNVARCIAVGVPSYRQNRSRWSLYPVAIVGIDRYSFHKAHGIFSFQTILCLCKRLRPAATFV